MKGEENSLDGISFLPNLKELARRLENENPVIFMSPGGPEGDGDGVTIWEHGTTNSLFIPAACVGQLVQKIQAVARGDSKAEMIQR